MKKRLKIELMFSAKSDNLILTGNKYSINEFYDLLISLHKLKSETQEFSSEIIEARERFLAEIHKGLPELTSLNELLEAINSSKLISEDKYLLKRRINSEMLKKYLSIFANPQNKDFLSVKIYANNLFVTTPLISSKLGQQSKEIISNLLKS
ncbi:MAG: hypothetical protein ACKVOQ_02345 [Cyclobacteriaceae bacterium]